MFSVYFYLTEDMLAVIFLPCTVPLSQGNFNAFYKTVNLMVGNHGRGSCSVFLNDGFVGM